MRPHRKATKMTQLVQKVQNKLVVKVNKQIKIITVHKVKNTSF